MRLSSLICLTITVLLLTNGAFAQDQRTSGTQPVRAAAAGNYSETYRQLNLFGDVFERVRGMYVDPVEDKQLIENALNGMLSALDPHSSYLNESQFADMQVSTKGEFGGLGIEVTMEDGIVKVVSPIDETPAFKAGIKAGDYIVALDGQTVMGLSLNDAVDKMRGKVGTAIKLLVRREGVAEPLEFTIMRDVIKIQSVRSKVINNAGYIRITAFNQNTDDGVKKAVEDIKKKLGDKVIGYVIDLRNNPGGLLNQAIAVSDDFIDKGEIVSTRGRDPKDIKRDNATPGDIAGGLPLVVLINGGSASAAEIVSGALQDHKRAILLGTKSFGKGSVQTVIPLPSGGAMRLTTARYYTPSGRSIQAKGIEPDILVEPAKIETIASNPYGLHEADLRGALRNESDKEKEQEAKTSALLTAAAANNNKLDEKVKTGKDAKEAGKPAPDPDDPSQDYQLLRGLDILNGVSLYKSGTQN